MAGRKIFVINSGSTSIKVAVFEEKECILKETIAVDKEVTSRSLRAVDQLPTRTALVEKFLEEHNVDLSEFSMISSRGGPLPACKCGAYAVNDWMIDVLTYAPTTVHASATSCMIGDVFAKKYNIPHIIYDSVMSDELDDVARYTGLPGVYITSGCHTLNIHAVSKLVAERIGMRIEDTNFIVVHMGGGCTFCAVKGGRIIDYHNDFRGTITPERCGTLPCNEVIKLCFSGKYTEAELQRLVMGGSGFLSYVGTSDGRKVAEMADNGDKTAQLMFDMMSYQVAKQVGQMIPVLWGKVDRIIFTGGLSQSKKLMDLIRPRIDYIAPIEMVPGELEMEGLAQGALNVLDGKEEAKIFDLMPVGYNSKEELYKKFKPEMLE